MVSAIRRWSKCVKSTSMITIDLNANGGADERVYADALAFRPERWSSRPEMIKESSAYAPFSLGMFSIFVFLSLLHSACGSASFSLQCYYDFANNVLLHVAERC